MHASPGLDHLVVPAPDAHDGLVGTLAVVPEEGVSGDHRALVQGRRVEAIERALGGEAHHALRAQLVGAGHLGGERLEVGLGGGELMQRSSNAGHVPVGVLGDGGQLLTFHYIREVAAIVFQRCVVQRVGTACILMNRALIAHV